MVVASYTRQAQTLAQMPMSQADYDHKNEMKEAWKSYRGKFEKPLKVRANQPDDNVISNRCAPIVDKGVSFLFGQVLKIEATDELSDDEANEKPDSDVQDFIDLLWGDDDQRMTLLSNMAINGGVCGQAFLKLIPAKTEGDAPRLVVMDPLLIRIVTMPDDCSCIIAYVIEYQGATTDMQKRQIISRIDPGTDMDELSDDDLLDYWTITNFRRRGAYGDWLQIGATQDWPYPFAPIFCCQNLPNPNEAWGTPDLTPDLISQNKVLNFIQSNTSRIIKYHAHPKTYATGLSASQINIGVDDLICLPSPDSKLANLEMTSNLTDSINFASIIRSDMDEQSRVPAVALGRITDLPRGNISGVALQLLFQPLIEKTVQKQRLYGEMIRDVTRAALVVAGKIDVSEYEDYKITLQWQNLLPSDDLLAAQRAVLLLQIGASKETLLKQLGFDPDEEAMNNEQEDEQKANSGQAMPPQIPQPNQQAAPKQAPLPGDSQQPGQANGGQN